MSRAIQKYIFIARAAPDRIRVFFLIVVSLRKIRDLCTCLYPDLRDNLSRHVDALCAELEVRQQRAAELRARHTVEKTIAATEKSGKSSLLKFRRNGRI